MGQAGKRPAWSWDDVVDDVAAGEDENRPRKRVNRFSKREDPKDHALTRFAHAPIEPERVTALRADHRAAVEGRTIFPASVVGPMETQRLLVSGHNNPKLGKAVRKGPWAGMALYHLTLEERRTCPKSCAQWLSCYGNAMPYARRHDPFHPHFEALLEAELWLLAREHAETGFVVRLHTLGDFYSTAYVDLWARWLDQIPGLHAYGYTAWDPEETEIGRAVQRLAGARWDRFAIRFSNRPNSSLKGAQGTVVIERVADLDDALLCPAQTDQTAACATCGLCWADSMRTKTIAFLRHGMKRAPKRRAKGPEPDAPTAPAIPMIEPAVRPPQERDLQARSAPPPVRPNPQRDPPHQPPKPAAALPAQPEPPKQAPNNQLSGWRTGRELYDAIQRSARMAPAMKAMTEEERRRLIDEAVAAGRVTRCPPAFAWGAEKPVLQKAVYAVGQWSGGGRRVK